MAYFGLGDDAKKQALKDAKAAAAKSGGGSSSGGGSADSGSGTVLGLPVVGVLAGLAVIGIAASQIVSRRRKSSAAA